MSILKSCCVVRCCPSLTLSPRLQLIGPGVGGIRIRTSEMKGHDMDSHRHTVWHHSENPAHPIKQEKKSMWQNY